MCESMVDIQSAMAEIRRGKKERRKKKQDKNIMSASATQGGHNKWYSDIIVIVHRAVKTAKPIVISFGMLHRGGPKELYIRWGPDPPYEGAILRAKGARRYKIQGLSAVSCAKPTEAIENPFGMWIRVGPRKHVLYGAQIPTGKGATLRAKRPAQDMSGAGGRYTQSDSAGGSTGAVQCGCRMGSTKWGSHWRHLTNTTEASMCDGDAALCQILWLLVIIRVYATGTSRRNTLCRGSTSSSAIAERPRDARGTSIRQHLPLTLAMLADFQNSFTDRLNSKFLAKR